MSQTPFEEEAGLRVGTVDFVSPDEIKVSLEIDAPTTLALNAGNPRPFPRVNGYLLVPVDEVYVVGQVEWLTVEHSQFPKRRGMQDFGLLDLPFPLRKLKLNPLGTLTKVAENKGHRFRRGTESLPTIGSPVLLPSEEQLRSIVESGERRRVKIGTSPLAADAEVSIDPDRLFGRHLAVLGNTGSGKSCSVAGLIRWCLEESGRARNGGQPNARFIILDPNGEYSSAFPANDEIIKARVFQVPKNQGDKPTHRLKVPIWLWNSVEWCSFTQASAKTQRPTLMYALRLVRDGKTAADSEPDRLDDMRRFLRVIVAAIRVEARSGNPYAKFPYPKNFFEQIERWKEGIEEDIGEFDGDQREKLDRLVESIEQLCAPRRAKFATYTFKPVEIRDLLRVGNEALTTFSEGRDDELPVDVDAPIPFEGESLLRVVEAVAGLLRVSDHVETLLVRIRALLTDSRMAPVLRDDTNMSLVDWLEEYIGGDGAQTGPITVIDLSLVPMEVVHVLTAVIARIIFEASQRYLKHNGRPLPSVLVMEEAHNFVKRYKDDTENEDVSRMCCRVFERIAREGRKFGLGLVLSSQRPSELSPTVLSQCNSFLLHRISNDRDQELVQRLVPDNLRGLLRELPSLPSQSAILLGWASELPVLVRMNDLPKKHRPRSEDPDFWDVWVGFDEDGKEITRKIDWNRIAEEWQGKGPSDVKKEE